MKSNHPQSGGFCGFNIPPKIGPLPFVCKGKSFSISPPLMGFKSPRLRPRMPGNSRKLPGIPPKTSKIPPRHVKVRSLNPPNR
ncbi:hypothetical protein SEA_BAUER_34 [Arthrobacter phage Bauer]|uniref:Uncharacterized protein n=1 Tax=Arthrobacter phage Bauer TaxID=2985648 RepID=A0A9E8A9U3_9CAUD|nr:hypothetical protein QEO99_gp34 [Arthrobacter phage Bauer]UYM26583.1 hypothetical protein SEA_BAUER_34 [Arthrobacter phage Bauer]